MNVDLVAVVPRHPRRGETVVGTSFAIRQGGKGANQATACAQLGFTTHLVACVGRDSFGQSALDDLQHAGVLVATISRASSPTGVALITVDPGGSNSIAVVPAANDELTGDAVQEALDALSRPVSVVLSCLEVPSSAVRRAAEWAAAAGARFVLNPAPAGPIGEEILALTDVVTPNEQELRELGGMDALQSRGAHTIVVTLGNRGARLVERDRSLTQAAFEVDSRDTTGAGDAFNAALACALAEGQSFEDALPFACAAGALATRRLGARASLPTRAEVDRLVAAGRGGVLNPL